MMFIEKVSYKNLRNLKDETIALHPKLNILYGQNAQGKTNFLEGIYFSAVGKSHRTARYKELIKFDCDFADIELKINREGLKDRISVNLKQKKEIAINGQPINRLGELFGVVYVQLFSPEDLNLVKSGPGMRRRLIDLNLCQLSPVYYYELGRYYHVLNQRNNLLKSIKKNKTLLDTLTLWDEQLSFHGSKIQKYRAEYIEEIESISRNLHKRFTDKKENLSLIYKPNTNPEELMPKLKKNLERDILLGSTSAGIHKDDIEIKIDNREAKTYASQGQQRSAVISLKLSWVEYIYKHKSTYPILLLDDILSELDLERGQLLLEETSKVQTILTCTDKEIIKKSANLFFVENGYVKQVN